MGKTRTAVFFGSLEKPEGEGATTLFYQRECYHCYSALPTSAFHLLHHVFHLYKSITAKWDILNLASSYGWASTEQGKEDWKKIERKKMQRWLAFFVRWLPLLGRFLFLYARSLALCTAFGSVCVRKDQHWQWVIDVSTAQGAWNTYCVRWMGKHWKMNSESITLGPLFISTLCFQYSRLRNHNRAVRRLREVVKC